MDLEKAMEFVLLQQAKAEAQIAIVGKRQAKTDAQIAIIAERQARAEETQAKADKQIAAILKLIKTGMRMITKQGESIKQLTEAQKVTEVKLQGLFDSLRRGASTGPRSDFLSRRRRARGHYLN